MIQFLLPLLGSIGGQALATQLGGGLLTNALLQGGGSFLGSKLAGADTEDALMSGLLSGGLGALGARGASANTLAKGASAAQGAGAAAPALSMLPEEMAAPKAAGGSGAFPAQAMASAPITQPLSAGAQQGAGLGSLQGIGNWVQRNPGLALAGAGMVSSLFPNAPPVSTSGSSSEGAPENFPVRRGPQGGYGRQNMTEEQYRTYGQAGSSSSSEFPFFQETGLTGMDLGGSGGFVTGGRRGTDTVPAVGPGGQPYLLNNGEYILPREAVRAIGVGNLDRIRSQYV